MKYRTPEPMGPAWQSHLQCAGRGAKPQHRTHQTDAEVSEFLDHRSAARLAQACLNAVSVVCG